MGTMNATAAILAGSLLFGQFVYEPPAEDLGFGFAFKSGHGCRNDEFWRCRSWLGVGFEVQDITHLTGVEALFRTDAGDWGPSPVRIGLYSGGDLPQVLLDSWTFELESGYENPPVWDGVLGIEKELGAGTYFLTFEVDPEYEMYAGIRAGGEGLNMVAMGGEIELEDVTWRQTFGEPIMVRIYGTEENRGIGDYNENGIYDAEDIDLLSQAILAGETSLVYDLDFSGSVNAFDRLEWQRRAGGITAGDANVDGLFDTSDMIRVFQHGKFETDEVALWSDGDWSGNGSFGTDDLILAFQVGRYEQPRLAIAAVPEPCGLILWGLGVLISLGLLQRNRNHDGF